MPPSYRSIDYSIRPAKHAERRMIADALTKASKFCAVSSYRYVGFGSIWFSDFVHFHRSLGVQDMISIEREVSNQRRFEFNKPFGGITLMFGKSGTILPQINWTVRSIVWLDYDDPLNKSMLADVRTMALAATSGAVLAVTVQAENAPTIMPTSDEELVRSVENVEQLRAEFGASRMPVDVKETDLRGWKLADLTRKILLSEIDDALGVANLNRPAGQHFEFKQIAAIEYADGAKMTTILGMFVDQGQNQIYRSCGFDELTFYSPGENAVRIEIPKLTPREMRLLDTRLPLAPGATIDPGVAPPRDANAYARNYRYLPEFATFSP